MGYSPVFGFNGDIFTGIYLRDFYGDLESIWNVNGMSHGISIWDVM